VVKKVFKMKKVLLLLLVVTFQLSALSFHLVWAQDISISASVDRPQVSLDQQVTLRVVVSGNVSQIPQPQIPGLPDFNIYSSGQSQNISIVNGQISSSVTFNFVLAPKKIGKFTIPPISVQVGGKAFSSAPISIEVVQAAAQAQAPQQQAPAPGATGNIFVTGTVDKQTAYVNEQITFSFKFYRNINLMSNPQYKQPEYTGFWIEDLPPQKTYYEVVNGQRYFVVELKTGLFPTAAGNYTIGSANLVCNVEDFSPPTGFFDDSFFQSFFSRGKTHTLTTNPIQIKVLPLPQGKPRNFSGMVGQYRIEASADKQTVEANQPITLKATISGVGNIKTISEPAIEGLTGFRKYNTIPSMNVTKENYVVQGSKAFTTMLVPQTAGKLTIPAVEISFFDPASRSYRTVSANPVSITALPSTKPAAQLPSAFSPQGIKFLGRDIRYLKTSGRLLRKTTPVYEQPWFIILQLLPLLALLVSFIYSRQYNRLITDIKYMRLHRAFGTAEKNLRGIKEQDPVKTACAISGVLAQYIADKLNIAAPGLTSAMIEKNLLDRGTDQETVAETLDIISKCDFVRYAPLQAQEQEVRGLAERTKAIINKLEKTMKTRK